MTEPDLDPRAGAPARLSRSGEDRIVLGVCGGLARGLGMPARPLRLVWALSILAGGAGAAAYLVALALMPAPDPRESVRPGRARLVEAGVIVLCVVVAAFVLHESGVRLPLGTVAVVLLLVAGLVLVWRHVLAPTLDLAAVQAELPRTRSAIARSALGVVLVVIGVAVLLRVAHHATAVVSAVIAASAVASGLGLVLGPRLARARAEAAYERTQRLRNEERAVMAARLHDSVLQTLALIQRTPDARQVQLLAHRQERELRAWLYGGRAPDAQGTLGDALRAAAAEVETGYGVAVALVLPRDVELDERLEALVAAAREAITNAAKHAEVTEISVLAQVRDADVSLYVRDRGRGFDPEAIDPDRRGVRDSIRGRMARHGGQAEIVSAPGEGTEIELHLPRTAR